MLKNPHFSNILADAIPVVSAVNNGMFWFFERYDLYNFKNKIHINFVSDVFFVIRTLQSLFQKNTLTIELKIDKVNAVAH